MIVLDPVTGQLVEIPVPKPRPSAFSSWRVTFATRCTLLRGGRRNAEAPLADRQ